MKTVRTFAPGPLMVTLASGLFAMTRFPLVRVIVCGVLKTVESKVIMSAPAAALASRIACLRLPAPLSFVLVTTKVARLGSGCAPRADAAGESFGHSPFGKTAATVDTAAMDARARLANWYLVRFTAQYPLGTIDDRRSKKLSEH